MPRKRHAWRRRAAPAAVAALLAVSVVSRAADVRKGGELYATHCANCHGPDGAPAMPGAPDLRRGAALLRTDAQLLDAIRRGRGAMPAYVGVLKEREILDVIVYMRTLAARGAGGARRKRRREPS
jgi:cytochrome c6